MTTAAAGSASTLVQSAAPQSPREFDHEHRHDEADVPILTGRNRRPSRTGHARPPAGAEYWPAHRVEYEALGSERDEARRAERGRARSALGAGHDGRRGGRG